MLSVLVFAPLLAALVLLAVPRLPGRVALLIWAGTSGAVLLLVLGMWLGYDNDAVAGPSGIVGDFAYETNATWIPSVGSRYHLGVDGLSLPLVALTAGLFFACALYSLREQRRPRVYAALFLFLESVSLGLFVALDLLLFFVFFDLSIVGMYFVIAGWGAGERAARSALTFFLYTFLGSLALLLGFLGLYVAATPHTFDLVELARNPPLEGRPLFAGLVLAALVVGLAVKTPTVPFHTWLPPAHTDAPAAGSAILAGVLLKMGAYGFVRITLPLLPEAWRRFALVLVIVGVVSVLWGALVALAQTDVKRMIAYTSVNHMGYIVLAVGAAGLVSSSDAEGQQLAITGAVTQMVSHGLLTGALFLLAGVLHERGGTYDMGAYGGLAVATPRFAGVFAVAAFASLGLPGFSGFVAEFQIFTGSLGPAPVATGLALLGILLTAGLFLAALHRIFLGESRPEQAGLRDLIAREASAIVPLLALAVLIGVLPRFLLDVIEPGASQLAGLVSR